MKRGGGPEAEEPEYASKTAEAKHGAREGTLLAPIC